MTPEQPPITNQHRVGAVIVAAGSSSRFGQDKLRLPLLGRPLLLWTLDAFEQCPSVEEIVLVTNESSLDYWKAMLLNARSVKISAILIGGKRRQDSVEIGVRGLEGCELVAVHDGARPLVTQELIERGIAAARASRLTAIPGVPAKDTIKRADRFGDGSAQEGRKDEEKLELVVETLDRASLRLIQTPQVCYRAELLDAYSRQRSDLTDEASLIESDGGAVVIYGGDYSNIKVTTREDALIAEAFLRQRRDTDAKQSSADLRTLGWILSTDKP